MLSVPNSTSGCGVRTLFCNLKPDTADKVVRCKLPFLILREVNGSAYLWTWLTAHFQRPSVQGGRLGFDRKERRLTGGRKGTTSDTQDWRKLPASEHLDRGDGNAVRRRERGSLAIDKRDKGMVYREDCTTDIRIEARWQWTSFGSQLRSETLLNLNYLDIAAPSIVTTPLRIKVTGSTQRRQRYPPC